MSSELLNVIDQVGREKGIDKNVLKDVIISVILSASKKKLNLEDNNIEADFNEKTGDIEVFVLKKVVEKLSDERSEIGLDDALELNPETKVGESVKVLFNAGDLGRISAHMAKQVIIQKVREAEREAIFNEFLQKKGEMIRGVVTRFEKDDIIIDLGKTEAILPRREQSFRERFQRGDAIKTYLLDLKRSSRRAQIILSRTHPGLVMKLFESEVPEIQEGIIEIKGAVREPNGRSKIAVHSKESNIDAVGSCVGIRGIRVQSVVMELRGEKLDIVEWSEDASEYVTHALKPAEISRVEIKHDTNSANVIVPKEQLSLAIGKSGQNVRLASKLTGWKINIIDEADLKREAESMLKKKKVDDGVCSLAISEIDELKSVISILEEHNIKTVEDIFEAGAEGLMALPSIGAKRSEKILAAVQNYRQKMKDTEVDQEGENDASPHIEEPADFDEGGN